MLSIRNYFNKWQLREAVVQVTEQENQTQKQKHKRIPQMRAKCTRDDTMSRCAISKKISICEKAKSGDRHITNNNSAENTHTMGPHVVNSSQARWRRRGSWCWNDSMPAIRQLLLLTCLSACLLEVANSAIDQSLIISIITPNSTQIITTKSATMPSSHAQKTTTLPSPTGKVTTTTTTQYIKSNPLNASSPSLVATISSVIYGSDENSNSTKTVANITTTTATTIAERAATAATQDQAITTTATKLSLISSAVAVAAAYQAATTTAPLTATAVNFEATANDNADAAEVDMDDFNVEVDVKIDGTQMASTTPDDNDDTNASNHETDTQLLTPQTADSLTKGFSIPTFLPPFPEFAIADLPSYAATTGPTITATSTASATELALPIDVASLSSDLLQQQQDQLYLAAFQQHPPTSRQNLTMPATNVTVQMGNHAYMPCHIRRLMNKPVSWVRVRDGHILSVDQTTFIADQRFQSIFQGENEYTWSLQIKYVQGADEGWYECQVSTEPKMSAKVYLKVVVPRTELIGDQNRFVKAGSKVALHCIVRGTLDPPTYIIWFLGKTQITDDNKMGWYTEVDRTIFGNAGNNQNTIGSLIIPFVRKKDSGNYTCQPSNSAPVSVDLHVLSGEYSASAIMSAASTHRQHNNTHYLLPTLTLSLVLLMPLSAACQSKT